MDKEDISAITNSSYAGSYRIALTKSNQLVSRFLQISERSGTGSIDPYP